jgi:hypothetical protein
VRKPTEDELAIGWVVAWGIWALVVLPIIYLHDGNLSGSLNEIAVLVTALATIAIAAFTLNLKWSTDKLWKAGEDQFRLAETVSDRQASEIRDQIAIARESADAVKHSADAAVAAERARFFIVIEKHNLTEIIEHVENRGALASGENFSIQCHFKNYGKTPGIIKELSIGSMIVPHLPDDLPFILSAKDFPEHMIGAGWSTQPDQFYSPVTLPNDAQVRAIGRNTTRFWLYGRLYYDDVFGQHQVHCFYFRSVSTLGQKCVLEPFEPKNQKKST